MRRQRERKKGGGGGVGVYLEHMWHFRVVVQPSFQIGVL